MKTIFTIPKSYFTVSKTDVNNYNALLPTVLYTQMLRFATTLSLNYSHFELEEPLLQKIKLLQNAFLNDKLVFQATVTKHSETSLELLVFVNLKNVKKSIGKASFKFNVKKNTQHLLQKRAAS
ncbi:hypothetical protein [Lutibacter sp.]